MMFKWIARLLFPLLTCPSKETRRCRHCHAIAYKCDCPWVAEAEHWEKMQEFGRASRVYRSSTKEFPPGAVCAWGEQPC